MLSNLISSSCARVRQFLVIERWARRLPTTSSHRLARRQPRQGRCGRLPEDIPAQRGRSATFNRRGVQTIMGPLIIPEGFNQWSLREQVSYYLKLGWKLQPLYGPKDPSATSPGK